MGPIVEIKMFKSLGHGQECFENTIELIHTSSCPCDLPILQDRYAKLMHMCSLLVIKYKND